MGHGINPFGLFMEASLVVKFIILLLLSMSIWCWAIIFAKVRLLKVLHTKAKEFEERFWSGQALDQLYQSINGQPDDPMSATFFAGMREWKRAKGTGSAETDSGAQSLKMRIERAMNLTVDREVERINKYTTVLATTAATAPFIGLFGTVWGIMEAFAKIAQETSVNIATVSGPISEALYATAIGLFAAIPAVVGYNKINKDVDNYGMELDTFAGEFLAIVSRRLSERNVRKQGGDAAQTQQPRAQRTPRYAEYTPQKQAAKAAADMEDPYQGFEDEDY